MTDQQKLAETVRSITLLAAELAFVALITSFILQTWQADSGSPPELSDVQTSAAGALAVVLGAGYAVTLGVPTTAGQRGAGLGAIVDLLRTKLWLSLGVLIYMFAGIAVCATYALNELETPGILKTVAVAFGGYVIAYIGTAYRQLAG